MHRNVLKTNCDNNFFAAEKRVSISDSRVLEFLSRFFVIPMLFTKLSYLIVKLALRRCFLFLQMYYAGRNSSSPVYSLSFNRTSLYVALANGVRMLDFTV